MTECPDSITISPQNKKYCIEGDCLFNYDKSYLIAYLKNNKTVTVPDGVKVIGESAFFCKNIEEIHLPDSVCRIEKDAFSSCEQLKQINLPNSINAIESGAFSVCCSLAEITLPKNLKIISSYTFRDCWSLETVVIPNGVTAIEEEAFAGCPNLDMVYIPDSVMTIHEDAFDDKFEAVSAVLFICSENSCAREFAREKGIAYITE